MNNHSKYKPHGSIFNIFPWLIVFIAAVIIVLINWRFDEIIEGHIEEFREISQVETVNTGKHITHTIWMLYQSLRTIARMPGTRTIDRYGKNFDLDARSTFQELYNNLYTSISLSELYIVPNGFDPDETDPNTGKGNEPILTIDEFIVGRHADKSHTKNIGPIEEIEIYEYRLMREQLQWLNKNYPTEASFPGLKYPAISGSEVITCDNTNFSPAHPDDKDRSGIVYSVPFYGLDGNLRGMVTGVVLTKVLQGLIPDGNYALINTQYDYIITPTMNGVWQQSIDSIRKGQPDQSLFFSSVIDLPIIDKDNAWKLWSGYSKSTFFESDEIVAYQQSKIISIIVVILFAIGIFIIYRQQSKRRFFILNQNIYLEEKIQERTQALTHINDALVKANNSKADFLSRVSHELRTPLNAIIGYSDLLLEDGFSDVNLCIEDIGKIKHSGAHLLSLINEVLDISKIEAGKMEINVESISVKGLIDEVICTVKPLIENNNNQLVTTISEEIDCFTTDQLKIKQILLNLLSNASKFTHNGKISISVNSKYRGGEELFVFNISDTGIGIGEDKLKHIFEEFYQAHSDSENVVVGTGLGLAISMRLANLLQGSIEAISSKGKGSTFTLVIPKDPTCCLIPSRIVANENTIQIRNAS